MLLGPAFALAAASTPLRLVVLPRNVLVLTPFVAFPPSLSLAGKSAQIQSFSYQVFFIPRLALVYLHYKSV
jgi:hypothetical protein